MGSLSEEQLHFAWVSIVCVDILKLPLKDILWFYIKPKQLQRKLSLHGLILSSEQQKACCSTDPNKYNDFDISLLYTLLRSLCSQLKPSVGYWGIQPLQNHQNIADNIERIRLFRNGNYGHAKTAKISKSKLNDLWKDAEAILKRMYTFTTNNRCNSANYLQMLMDVRSQTVTYEDYTNYQNIFKGKMHLAMTIYMPS